MKKRVIIYSSNIHIAGTPPIGVVPHQRPLDVAAQHVPGNQRCCVEDLIIHTGLTNLIRKKGPLHFK